MLIVRRLNLDPTSDRLCTVSIISFLMGEIELKIPTWRDHGEDEVRKGPSNMFCHFESHEPEGG